MPEIRFPCGHTIGTDIYHKAITKLHTLTHRGQAPTCIECEAQTPTEEDLQARTDAILLDIKANPKETPPNKTLDDIKLVLDLYEDQLSRIYDTRLRSRLTNCKTGLIYEHELIAMNQTIFDIEVIRGKLLEVQDKLEGENRRLVGPLEGLYEKDISKYRVLGRAFRGETNQLLQELKENPPKYIKPTPTR